MSNSETNTLCRSMALSRHNRQLYATLEDARAVVMATLAKAKKDGELGIVALDRLYESRPDVRRTWTGR
jgi:hypothetical protein